MKKGKYLVLGFPVAMLVAVLPQFWILSILTKK
jgi:hypothetical protein